MQQIMEAKGKNEVADTMDTIKKIVEDIPYLQARKGAGRSMYSSRKRQSISLQMKEIDGSLKLNFKELFG